MSKWPSFYDEEIKKIKHTLDEFEKWSAGPDQFDLPNEVQDVLRSGKILLEWRLETYENQISRLKGEGAEPNDD